MRYEPSEADLEYLRRVRSTRYNKEGLSKDGNFAILATFPIEVNIEMINLHGNNWIDKPGVLTDFLSKNPQYKVGQPEGGFANFGKVEVADRA